jgi:hypothetical protein
VSGEENSGRIVRLTTLPPTVSRLSRQYGILTISQPYRPPQPIKGMAFAFFFFFALVELKGEYTEVLNSKNVFVHICFVLNCLLYVEEDEL